MAASTGHPGNTLPLPVQPGTKIAVSVVDNGAGGTHTGICFEQENATQLYVHLAFHNRIWLEGVPGKGLHSVPQLVEQDENTLLAMLDDIVEANDGRLPYAFKYDGTTTVDPGTGVVRVGASSTGLTCSTFVLAVFASVGTELLVLDSWRERDGDEEWRAQIISMLEVDKTKGNVTRAHIEQVENERTCYRYRPEDVVAAAVLAPPPQMFAQVDEASREIRAHILDS